jgi:hypothetical protein
MRHVVPIVLLLILLGCSKPADTLDAFLAAQPVVSSRDMQRLLALLQQGDVVAFNQLRTNPPYAGKRLDFRNSLLINLSIPGADLSNSIFSGADLTGTDLRGASFRGSYLAGASVDSVRPGARSSRQTCLANCDFSGAILRATEYITTSEFQEPVTVWTKRVSQLCLTNADISGAIGIDFSLADTSRVGMAARAKRSTAQVLRGLVLIAKVAAIALGGGYLYLKHRQRAYQRIPAEDPRMHTGQAIEASKLRERLRATRRNHPAFRRGTSGVRFQRSFLGRNRRAIVRSGYFRNYEPNEQASDRDP